MQKCYGHAISENDIIINSIDVINKFNARERCALCKEAYNCFLISVTGAGYSNDQEIEKFLKQLRINTFFKYFTAQMEKNEKEIQSQATSQFDYLEKMQESFLKEITKEDNKELKAIFIKQIKQQYHTLTLIVESMKTFMEFLNEDVNDISELNTEE